MTRVNAHLFVNGAKTDFSQITIQNEQLKKDLVKTLFENDIIAHENSHAYNRDASFEVYFKTASSHFSLLDLNTDGRPELIFQGYLISGDDKEFTEIYAFNGEDYELAYTEVGHLLAYKIHPNTKEIVLFQHQYPCCSSASHNIHTLRLINKRIYSKSKYFLARDGGMLGNFFPENCHFGGEFKKLKTKTMLYWSDSIIGDNASLNAKSNAMIHYPKGTVYRELARRKSWSYILTRGTPVQEKSKSVNGENLAKMAVFAWIKSQ